MPAVTWACRCSPCSATTTGTPTAPPTDTLEGERREIWSFLGTDRLAVPILEHGPDLVLHGHAHAGRFEGRVGEVPVYNVSVPVMAEDFWLFELTGERRAPSEVR